MLDVAEKGTGKDKVHGHKKTAEELLKRQIEMVNSRIDDLKGKLDETLDALHNAETDKVRSDG